jgi:hypothetical protein
LHFTVDSQRIAVGSDDSSNGYSEHPDSEWLQSDTNDENADASNNQMNSFVHLAKRLEVQRLKNAKQANQLIVISDSGSEIEDEEWPIDRWLRLQAEEEAGTSGRLTAPRNEVRKRQPKKKPANKNDLQVNELRLKQKALVDEQLALQKIQKEIAELELNDKKEISPIVKEEALERLRLLKIKREIAEIELANKKSQS